jgi:hypothetical protein
MGRRTHARGNSELACLVSPHKMEMETLKRYSCLLALLAILLAGCGPGRDKSEFCGLVEATTNKCRASDIRQAALGMLEITNDLGAGHPDEQIPGEIVSLPIFPDARQIEVNIQRAPNPTNDFLFFYTGGGFGHRGLLVCRDPHNTLAWKSLHAYVIPWDLGVYFFLQK